VATNYPTFNAGRFSFNVTNVINGTNYINGAKFSGTNDAFLTEIILAPPVPSNFEVVPTNLTVGLGATVNFAVTFTGGTNWDMSFQWREKGTNLVNGGRISGANSATLTITNAQPTDANTNYGVIVSYPGGLFTESNLVLSVLPTPYIAVAPTNQILVTGSTVNFTVVASGSPINYFWGVSNSFEFVQITNSDRISGATNTTLTISNVQPSDAGFYEVVVQYSPNPNINTNAGALLVEPLSIISAPTNQTVSASSTVSFSVVATGFPLSYQWSNSVAGAFLTNKANISGATDSTLTITNVQTNDDGTYTVFVNNGQSYTSLTGSANLSATLSVLSDPTFTSFAPASGGVGNGMVLSGAGGTNNGTYYILTSSNLLMPAARWTPVATNEFNTLGQFIFTNPVSTNGSQFFILKQP
ncbi:MAG: immunoglobulin domain-containing protein, partial [Limisphaerales bacterium]